MTYRVTLLCYASGMRNLTLVTIMAACFQVPTAAQQGSDFHSQLMNSTVFIIGESVKPKDPAKTGSCGTGFLMRVESRSESAPLPVLITAAHVLDALKGPKARLAIRVRDEKQTIRMQALDIDIKAADGSAMYTKHPKEDLAAIHLSLPLNHALMFTRVSGLATDAVMAKLEIHPTDEMFTWGYPDCTPSSSQYYPILRRGVVASRVAAGENFLLDLPAIGGNSGGMVYFEYVNRYYANVIHNDEVYKYIAGVLTHSLNGLGGQPLGVSRIVPARYIEEILKSLPPR